MRFIDQIGNTIILNSFPKRIISLVPSQTELLHYLGLDEQVVGVTRFCIHPDNWCRSKTRIGGTKKINFSKIEKLNPDLIIGNKEENEKEQITELMKLYPVWMSNINSLEDAFEMIFSVGEVTDKKNKAATLCNLIQTEFELLKNVKQSKKVAYLIWRNPYMVAGGNTFINDMLKRCGLINVFSSYKRYPRIQESEFREKRPDLILLSSEPYPFNTNHINELSQICPESSIKLVDGEMFSWYGSRLLNSPEYCLSVFK